MGVLALDLVDTDFNASSVSLICGLNSVGCFNPISAMISLSAATTPPSNASVLPTGTKRDDAATIEERNSARDDDAVPGIIKERLTAPKPQLNEKEMNS
mmetsp:Transcript_8036/g.12204  ORF Transcript_8036/g.12204 Transcript_8036/m.12204 type:complete len:99 (+) Transcript_8036:465-761(+)